MTVRALRWNDADLHVWTMIDHDAYEANKDGWEASIAKLLGFPLTINFDIKAIWAYAPLNNASNAGDGVAYQLERKGFKGNEMLQEGFLEGVPSKTIKLRIADKISGENSEAILEDGVLYIQTTVVRWWSSIFDAGQDI